MSIIIEVGEDKETEMGNNFRYLKVSTNHDLPSLMLIGSRTSLTLGKLGYNMKGYRNTDIRQHQRIIIPELKDCQLTHSDNYLIGIGKNMDRNRPYNQDFELRYYLHELRQGGLFEGLGKVGKEINLPNIYWLGDINKDGILDIIFDVNPSMYSTAYLLYTSSVQDGKFNYKLERNYVPAKSGC